MSSAGVAMLYRISCVMLPTTWLSYSYVKCQPTRSGQVSCGRAAVSIPTSVRSVRIWEP